MNSGSKNIALLTYHRNFNYGWNLQCFALMSALRSLGHNPTLIDKRRFVPRGLSKLYMKYRLSDVMHKPFDWEYEQQVEARGEHVLKFWDRYITPRTKPIFYKRQLRSLKGFDAYVVGSDQVWRPKLSQPIECYYFDFVPDGARLMSYAASFGTAEPEYTPQQIAQCGELIKRFSNVSVREKAGADLIKNYYKWQVQPEVMPDPTLLLDADDYLLQIDLSEAQPIGTGIFAYILDDTDDKRATLAKIEDKTGLKAHTLSLNADSGTPLPSIETWIKAIKDSQMVYTDSYHGCVFALIFGKPFVVYGNMQRGLARMHTLLDHFDESRRLILSSKDLSHLDADFTSIDSAKIAEKHDDLKSIGLEYLRTSLA